MVLGDDSALPVTNVRPMGSRGGNCRKTRGKAFKLPDGIGGVGFKTRGETQRMARVPKNTLDEGVRIRTIHLAIECGNKLLARLRSNTRMASGSPHDFPWACTRMRYLRASALYEVASGKGVDLIWTIPAVCQLS